jgi:hypothetical protein
LFCLLALIFWLWPVTEGQVWNFPLVVSCQCSKSFEFWNISDFVLCD